MKLILKGNINQIDDKIWEKQEKAIYYPFLLQLFSRFFNTLLLTGPGGHVYWLGWEIINNPTKKLSTLLPQLGGKSVKVWPRLNQMCQMSLSWCDARFWDLGNCHQKHYPWSNKNKIRNQISVSRVTRLLNNEDMEAWGGVDNSKSYPQIISNDEALSDLEDNLHMSWDQIQLLKHSCSLTPAPTSSIRAVCSCF